jgi:hypothetical protein
MAEFPGTPGIVTDGPTLSNEFIVSPHQGVGIIKITVYGDDTLSGNLNGGQAMGLATSGPADTMYIKYNDGGAVGEDVMRGLLLEPVPATTAKGNREGLLVVGFAVVDESKTTGVDANGKADMGDRIVWV